MMKNMQKLVAKMDKMEAKFEKLGVSAKAGRVQEETWTCVNCKTEKCYAPRTQCFKCGESRVPSPPGLGAKAAAGQPVAKQEPAAAAPMEEEVPETLEERISELEDLLKFYKGKETVLAKAERLGVEGRLKELKEQQRQARPLPARLQAATDRATKAQQLCEESEAKVAAVCEELKLARQENEAAQEKKRAALQELEEVKKAAGAEPVVVAEKGLAAGMLAALAARNIVGADAEALLADVLQFYFHAKTGRGGPAVHPGHPAGPGSQPTTLPLRAPVRPGGRGRSLPREIPVPRDGSTSRSPRGSRDDE